MSEGGDRGLKQLAMGVGGGRGGRREQNNTSAGRVMKIKYEKGSKSKISAIRHIFLMSLCSAEYIKQQNNLENILSHLLPVLVHPGGEVLVGLVHLLHPLLDVGGVGVALHTHT